jgi:hypothetical protein
MNTNEIIEVIKARVDVWRGGFIQGIKMVEPGNK